MPSRRVQARMRIKRAWIVLAVLWAAACGRADVLGDVKFFPGASVVGSTSFVGEAYGFPRATWEQVELRSAGPYQQVHDFYAKTTIAGWTSTFESETPKSDGHVYTRYLADGRRRRFYVITVEERRTSHDVSVLLRRGVAK
jgi:hypothetical protein